MKFLQEIVNFMQTALAWMMQTITANGKMLMIILLVWVGADMFKIRVNKGGKGN